MVLGSVRRSLEPLALTLLRVSTGVIMAFHGWDKMKDIPGLVENLRNMGIPSPEISAYLAIAGEFGGGVGLILGFLTPLAALGVLSTMAVAVFHVHWKNGLLAKDGGFEYPLTLLLVALFFVMHGAGPISLDALFCRKKNTSAI